MIFLSLTLLPFQAGAQGHLNDNAALELNKADNLWISSDNAAGLLFQPVGAYNVVSLDYSYDSGSFHRKQSGSSLRDVNFDTQGALKVGKFQLWGRFAYNNIADNGTQFNTLLYDPFDERTIYNVADTVSSNWRKQSYEMEVKAAFPLLSDKLAAGLHVIYSDKLSAKQKDPRSESFRYYITLKPSLTLKTGKHVFGVNGYYSNNFERVIPTLSNSSETQPVYVLRGLGNYVDETVGSSGLSIMYYKCNTFGSAIQYNLDGPVRILAEVGFLSHSTNVRQSSTQPLKMGSTSKSDLTGSVRTLFGNGNGNLNKVTVSFSDIKTDGTEYTSVWDKGTGEWEVRSQAVMSAYSTLTASVMYDRYILEDNSFKWNYHAGLSWIDKSDEYMLPHSSFSYDNILVDASVFSRFVIGKSSLLTGICASYNLNLSGDYSYAGSHPSSPLVRDWYPHDINILTSDYYKAGLKADYCFPLKGKINLSVSGDASYLYVDASLDRFCIRGAVALIF